MCMTQFCDECEFMKRYDYGKRIYCCDHPDRIDDMGKLSVGHLPEATPAWCPIRCNQGNEEIKKVCIIRF